jgi:hypothetical protein
MTSQLPCADFGTRSSSRWASAKGRNHCTDRSACPPAPWNNTTRRRGGSSSSVSGTCLRRWRLRDPLDRDHSGFAESVTWRRRAEGESTLSERGTGPRLCRAGCQHERIRLLSGATSREEGRKPVCQEAAPRRCGRGINRQRYLLNAVTGIRRAVKTVLTDELDPAPYRGRSTPNRVLGPASAAPSRREHPPRADHRGDRGLRRTSLGTSTPHALN